MIYFKERKFEILRKVKESENGRISDTDNNSFEAEIEELVDVGNSWNE